MSLEKENLKDPMHHDDPLIHPYGQVVDNNVSYDPLAVGKPEDAVMDKEKNNKNNKNRP